MTSRNAAPALRFMLRDYRIYMNFGLLSRLGCPLYLEFLYEDERKLLAISGSMKKRKCSFEIPERIYRDAGEECCVSRMPLSEAFRIRMKWNKNESYRVVGEYIKHLGVVVFDLTTAIVVTKENVYQSLS